MSAPFPLAPTGSPGPAGQVQLVPERDEFVPPGYVPHENAAEIEVTYEGEPLGFTVADMLRERRWAVQPDGACISQLEFQDRYKRKLQDYYRYASTEARNGHPKVPSSFNVDREPVPHVKQYVSWKVDPRDARKILPMHFDPDANRGAKPQKLWDSTNERWIEGSERLRLLTDYYRRDPSKLKAHEVAEVEASLGGAIPVQSPESGLRAQLQLLADMKNDGVISVEEYAARVAKLAGSDPEPEKTEAAPAEPEEPKAKRGHTIMACGEEVPNMRRRQHSAGCVTCKERETS